MPAHNATTIEKIDINKRVIETFSSILAAAKSCGKNEAHLRRYMNTCEKESMLYEFSDTGFCWKRSNKDYSGFEIRSNKFSHKPKVEVPDDPESDFKTCPYPFTKYKVSKSGEVISKKTNEPVKLHPNFDGYNMVDLVYEPETKKYKRVYVHYIVIITFIDEKFPINELVEFKNGDKNDCSIDNLILHDYSVWRTCCAPYQRYKASTSGQIKNILSDKIVSIYKDTKTIVRLTIDEDNEERDQCKISHIIAKTFIEPNFDVKIHKIKHIDGDETNNSVNNLQVKMRTKVWKLCPEPFEKYEISEKGKVRNKDTLEIMKHCIDKDGYHTVRLTSNTGCERRAYVHSLLIKTYKNPDFYYRELVEFVDCDKSNITIENIKFMSSQNIDDFPKWKRCPDVFSKLKCSRNGKVKNTETGEMCEMIKNKDGYKYIKYKYIKYKHNINIKNRNIITVHRLMAITFFGYHDDATYTVDHINRKRDDNKITNLRWASKSLQAKNRGSFNRKSGCSDRKIVVFYPDGISRKLYDNALAVSKEFGIHVSSVYANCNSKINRTKSGCKFMYLENVPESQFFRLDDFHIQSDDEYDYVDNDEEIDNYVTEFEIYSDDEYESDYKLENNMNSDESENE